MRITLAHKHIQLITKVGKGYKGSCDRYKKIWLNHSYPKIRFNFDISWLENLLRSTNFPFNRYIVLHYSEITTLKE